MKRSLLLVCSAFVFSAMAWGRSALAQGTVNFVNDNGTLVRTNALGLGGSAGNTAPNPGGFFYGLFIAPSTVSALSPLDLLEPTWTFTGVYATNTAVSTGGRLFGGFGVPVPGWYDATNAFALAGWSANVAVEDWSTVRIQLLGASLINGVWVGANWRAFSNGGFFGVSEVGFGDPPGPPEGRPSIPLITSAGNTGFCTPISSGFDLFVINVPEPTVLALFVAGAAVGLSLRRRRT